MQERKEGLERQVEAELAAGFPEVELIDLEVRGGAHGVLTLFVDRAGGVDLELCSAISRALEHLCERYSLEVSSPGLNRRLRKPAHFAAALGHDIAVTMTEPLEGRRNYRGSLAAAGETTITLHLDDGGVQELPIAGIARAHVIYNFESDGGQHE